MNYESNFITSLLVIMGTVVVTEGFCEIDHIEITIGFGIIISGLIIDRFLYK